MEILTLNHQAQCVHSTQDNQILRKTVKNCNTIVINFNKNNNNIANNSRPKSPNHNRDGNRSRQPFSRNRLRNVRNYINTLLDQEQTDETTSNIEYMETQSVSEEKLFNDLLLALNQDIQDENFVCQDECYSLTEKYILYTSCKGNFWVLPLTIYTQHKLDHTKTNSPTTS